MIRKGGKEKRGKGGEEKRKRGKKEGVTHLVPTPYSSGSGALI